MRINFFLILLLLAGSFACCTSHSKPGQPFSEQKEINADLQLCFKENKKDCCENPESSTTSEITCPNCGFKKTETLPTKVCQLSYTCQKCNTVMHPQKGDCCVFCTYGDHKCPSKQ